MDLEEHRDLADAAEREADAMEKAAERLGERIDGVREDWRDKSGQSVPGPSPAGRPEPRETSPDDGDAGERRRRRRAARLAGRR